MAMPEEKTSDALLFAFATASVAHAVHSGHSGIMRSGKRR